MDSYRSIALVEKTHGRKGEVVVRPAHGLPLLLRESMEVALLPPDLKGPRWRKVCACSEAHGGQLVRFDGITGLDAARKLVGKTVLAKAQDLPDDLYLQDVERLLGKPVVDVALGPLGAIEEVMRGPAQDVWVVRGELGEVLIPAVEPIVREVGACAVVAVPEGLVARQPDE